MTDDRQRREMRRLIMQELAHDLRMVYAENSQLPPRLQAFLHRLDEQQEQDR